MTDGEATMSAEEEIDMLLDEADAFRRGGEPLEALARARFAGEALEQRKESVEPAKADELRARVDFTVRHYETLVEEWQTSNDARHVSYLARERSALARPPDTR
jgi:hypothetical protein